MTPTTNNIATVELERPVHRSCCSRRFRIFDLAPRFRRTRFI